MSSPMPAWQYLVAFNNDPLDDPATITTIASPAGTLGAANVWTDITPWVVSRDLARGRQHELDRFEAGTLTLELGPGSTNDARFNPWNTSSPYTGKLNPGKLVQVRATYNSITYKLFTGNVTAWPSLWPDAFSQWGRIEAVDAFRYLALADLPSSAYAREVQVDAPVAWWRLSDPDASNLADSAGGYDGSYTGAVTFGAASLIVNDADTAASFDGSTGYASVSNTGGLVSDSTDLTIEFWMNRATRTGTWQEGLLWGGTTANSWIVILNSGFLLFNLVPRSGGTPIGFQSDNSVADGAVHHVVCTWTKSSGAMKIYIDGVLQSGSATATAFNDSTSAQIAAAGGDGFTANWASFNGTLDEVAIYHSVLSSTRITAHRNAGLTPWKGDASGTRLGRILDVISWPAGARNIDVGSSTLQAAKLNSSKALTYMQLVEDSENGAMFITGDGKVRFIARQNLIKSPYNTSQATFGDNAGELAYQPDVDLALDDLDTWNDVRCARDAGVEQAASDSSSQTTYGKRTLSQTGLLYQTDAESSDRANWLLAHYKTPLARLRKISIQPLDDPTNIFPAVLARELMDRITVNRHAIPGGGTAFTQIALIEHIADHADADTWTVSYALSPADTQAYLILDDATFGVLDGSNLVGY